MCNYYSNIIFIITIVLSVITVVDFFKYRKLKSKMFIDNLTIKLAKNDLFKSFFISLILNFISLLMMLIK